MAKSAVVADTSPLIGMARIGLLSPLTRLFDAVFVPPAVIAGATRDLGRPDAQRIRQALTDGQLTERPVTVKSTNLMTRPKELYC